MPALSSRYRSAFTLIEILVATGLSFIIISTLLAALNAVTNSFEQGSGKIEEASEADAIIALLKRDLASAYSGRENDPGVAGIENHYFPVTNSSDSARQNSLAPATAKLARRILLPFEINRLAGAIFDPHTGNPTRAWKSIGNALAATGDPDTYHPNYDAIAFVTRAPLTRQSHTSIDRSNSFGQQTLSDEDDALLRSDGDACLAAYYVAYTKNAAIPGAPASMKLFRHFRDSGSSRNTDSSENRSQGRSYYVLGEVVRRSLLPRLEGRLNNSDLPMLLTPVAHYDGRDAIHPWPRFPASPDGRLDYASLPYPPPENTHQGRDRHDPDSEASLYSDEPIANNILRFKITPIRQILNPESGSPSMAESREINRIYALNKNAREEWPVVLAPHAVKIDLLIIDDKTAALFSDQNDWEQWETKRKSSCGSAPRCLPNRNCHPYRNR